ncbi:MAG: hypothetical protein Q4G26_14175 [Paracoccus sp. (in: a-proteobacteria)]|nr:hypothetical protein [Paracoccus sp. (in: a-proteobacteria)]
MNKEDFIHSASSGRGAGPVSPEELIKLIFHPDMSVYWVTRLEAHERRGEKEIVDIDFAVVGLDGPENWESHHDIHRHDCLVMRKVEAARDSDRSIEFRVWIERRN